MKRSCGWIPIQKRLPLKSYSTCVKKISNYSTKTTCVLLENLELVRRGRVKRGVEEKPGVRKD